MQGMRHGNGGKPRTSCSVGARPNSAADASIVTSIAIDVAYTCGRRDAQRSQMLGLQTTPAGARAGQGGANICGFPCLTNACCGGGSEVAKAACRVGLGG